MSIRLVVTISAAPGKGSELAQAYKDRCAEAMKEPGCEQFEIFQGVANPDRLALLERWVDQAALDVHAKLNATKPALRPELRVGQGEREDYSYNRTRCASAGAGVAGRERPRASEARLVPDTRSRTAEKGPDARKRDRGPTEAY